MSRDAEERAMIAAGIETTDVEIPMVVCDDQQVRLDELAFAPRVSAHEFRIGAQLGFVRREAFVVMVRDLFMQTDEAVRVFRSMQCLEPLNVRVPFAEPPRAILSR